MTTIKYTECISLKGKYFIVKQNSAVFRKTERYHLLTEYFAKVQTLDSVHMKLFRDAALNRTYMDWWCTRIIRCSIPFSEVYYVPLLVPVGDPKFDIKVDGFFVLPESIINFDDARA